MADTEVNADQRAAWNGVSGDAWVRTSEEHDAALVPWAEILAAAAAIQPGERVLDIGCGCGATTLAAAGRSGPDGTVVGVDLSAQMLARARARADDAGLGKVTFVEGDAQVDDLASPLPGGDGYDAVISRYGVMFFDDPTAAFANIGRATRPGGRLALVVWAPLSEQQWLLVPAAAAAEQLGFPDLRGAALPGSGDVGMFAFAERARIDDVLGAAGWTGIAAEQHRRRVSIGGEGGVEQALGYLESTGPGRALFANAEPAAAERAREAVRAALAPHLVGNAVELDGVAWSVTATKPVL